MKQFLNDKAPGLLSILGGLAVIWATIALTPRVDPDYRTALVGIEGSALLFVANAARSLFAKKEDPKP